MIPTPKSSPTRRHFVGIMLLFAVLALPAIGLPRPALADSVPNTTVSLSVSIGYQNIFRGASWTPIRATLRNLSSGDINGTLIIPQSDQSASVGVQPAYHSRYEQPVALPAHSTKQVTVYVPGTGIQSRMDVAFETRGKSLATATAFPIGVDNATLLIGVLADTPGDYAWLSSIQRQVTTHVIHLSPTSLDSVPQALNAFDIIALTNTDTSQLDSAQLQALEAFARNGGSLLLVGGPSWQRTLRPLPSQLLPGRLSGMRTLPDLNGLAALDSAALTAKQQASGIPSVVALLEHPRGTVRASQSGVPLVVRRMVGRGAIEYVAFDPATLPANSPIPEQLVAMANPFAVTRTWTPPGVRARFGVIRTTTALTSELANVPAGRMPLLALFALLTLVYVLLLGPVNFFILRRLRRQHLAWFTMPGLALAYVGSMFGAAAHAQNSATQVNTISLVSMPVSGAPTGLTYLSLSPSFPGSYTLEAGPGTLATALPEISSPNEFSFRDAGTIHPTLLGMQIQELPQTNIDFLSMKRWDTRDVTLNATPNIVGSFSSSLSVDRDGVVVGNIHNGTNLDLKNPVLIIGSSAAPLRDVPYHSTIRLNQNPADHQVSSFGTSVWDNLYPGMPPSYDTFGGGFGDFSEQPPYPDETNLVFRERNALAMLNRAQVLPSSGGAYLAGWTQQPLLPLSVGGSAPRRRDLSFVITPISISLPRHGAFSLSPGVVPAHLVDILPSAPKATSSLGFGGPDESPQQLTVAVGGSFTFEFDIPDGGRATFKKVVLSEMNGSGTLGPARAYDWTTQHWIGVDLAGGPTNLAEPARFVSPQGRVLVQLLATTETGDLSFSDGYDAVMLSASGSAR